MFLYSDHPRTLIRRGSFGIVSKAVIFTLATFSLLHSSQLTAPVLQPQQPSTFPWLTGPLIAPPGTAIQKGHFEIESYLYVTTNTGTYDKHWHAHDLSHNFCSINPQIFSLFGITEWMDFQITPQLFYNITQNKSSIHFGDLPAGFDFQLYPDDASAWFPGVKFTLKEIFPTGKYQKLRPRKKGTDLSGQGSFQTNASLEFYKVYRLNDRQFLSATLYLGYTYLAPVHVKGFNAYGGGHHTRGKVHPGNILQGILSFEYALNQNWVLSIDNVYIHTNKNRFNGHMGFTDSGVQASVGGPSSEQISFAPAIEYNFSSHFGINTGAWVSAWGRNSTEFRSFVINFDYSY